MWHKPFYYSKMTVINPDMLASVPPAQPGEKMDAMMVQAKLCCIYKKMDSFDQSTILTF